MSPRAEDDEIERLALRVGRLLSAGVGTSAICLCVGLAIWMVAGPIRSANALLTAGLVVLMLTPVARVAASFVTYVRLRDWFFVWITVIVFAVLIAAWVLKS
jgi:uncharacterized membrane protein